MDKAVFDLYKGKIFFCLVSLQFLAGPVIIESKYGSPKICPHLVIILHNFFLQSNENILYSFFICYTVNEKLYVRPCYSWLGSN